MEVLLLTDVPGIGKKNDLIVVRNGFALNNLLPHRKALVVTPNVRRRYAEQIKRRALEKEHEKSMQASVIGALADKSVTVSGKATKTGKLYAAITEEMISQAIQSQLSISIAPEMIKLPEHIKSVGRHSVSVEFELQSAQLPVEVKAEEEPKGKKSAAKEPKL